MPRQTHRAAWLGIIAAINLILWAGAAICVGLVASDALDLGIEATVRKYRATAVAALPRILPAPGRLSGEPARTAPGAALSATAAAAGPRSQADTGSSGEQSASAAASKSSGDAPLRASEGEDGAQPPEPTPPPEVALLSQPLIMANPALGNLQELDAEMARSMVGRPVQIRYQEATLNQEIQALLDNKPHLPYEQVRVDLKRNEAILAGSVPVFGFRVRAEVRGSVVARECQPRLAIQSVRLSGLFTPSFVEDTIKTEIEKAMAWYPVDYPLCIEQIVLEEDRATLYGYRR